tara:strand:+ start:2756 stop:3184 length:429 start_codon:yes stop_codon:yes gene_type:complete
MSINDATPADWDRVRTSTVSQLIEVRKEAVEDAQREASRERIRNKWSKWCVTEKDIDDMMPEEDIHAAIAEARPDPVNNPSHYNTGGVEAIQAIEASMSTEAFQGYLKGNCMKYIWRMSYKGKAKEDTLKAQWYLNRLIETL